MPAVSWLMCSSCGKVLSCVSCFLCSSISICFVTDKRSLSSLWWSDFDTSLKFKCQCGSKVFPTDMFIRSNRGWLIDKKLILPNYNAPICYLFYLFIYVFIILCEQANSDNLNQWAIGEKYSLAVNKGQNSSLFFPSPPPPPYFYLKKGIVRETFFAKYNQISGFFWGRDEGKISWWIWSFFNMPVQKIFCTYMSAFSGHVRLLRRKD